MSREADIAWLACALDSEGSIYVGFQRYKRKDGTRRIVRINLYVMNSNREYVEKVCKIVMDLGATVMLHERDAHGAKSQRTDRKYKNIYIATVAGLRSVETVLTQILPWLMPKRAFALDVLKLISMAPPKGRNGWSDDALVFVESVREQHMPLRRNARAIGELPASDGETTPRQAAEGSGSAEAVETTLVSPNNNPTQERPESYGMDNYQKKRLVLVRS